MTNDQLCLFPMLSYGNKNTVGAVARLFFFDPPLKPHANKEEKTREVANTRMYHFGRNFLQLGHDIC